MTGSKDLKRKIVQLIASVYSQFNFKMQWEPYKSNGVCMIFYKKLKEVYKDATTRHQDEVPESAR